MGLVLQYRKNLIKNILHSKDFIQNMNIFITKKIYFSYSYLYLRIDTTAPTHKIMTPNHNSVIAGLIDISAYILAFF